MNSSWVSASSTRNFMLNDPIIDYLELYYEEENNDEDLFKTYILNKGNEFEKRVIEFLYSKYDTNIITIAKCLEDSKNLDKVEETKQAIKRGVPIIYQGVLHNHKNETYGIPDLIVRSDWLNKIVKDNSDIGDFPYTYFETQTGSKLNKKYHYVIVDIKMSCLKLASNETNILNSGSFPCYKAQLYVYTLALADLQGFNPKRAYILGCGWSSKDSESITKGYNVFSKLGEIDYDGYDKKLVPKFEDSIAWRKKIQTCGGEMDINEIPFNLQNKDKKWDHIKKSLKNKKAKIEEEPFSISPCKISKEFMKAITKGNLCFIDYESIYHHNFENFPFVEGKTTIFMIGVGRRDNEGNFSYKSYVAEKLSESEEKRIMMEMIEDICGLGESCKLISWGHTEPCYFSKIMKVNTDGHTTVHTEDKSFKIRWVDLLKLFREEPIKISNCENYSLKTISKALHKNGKIKTSWNEEESGLDVMVKAAEYYKNKTQNIIDDIIKYNEVDCKVMYEICEFLRREC